MVVKQRPFDCPFDASGNREIYGVSLSSRRKILLQGGHDPLPTPTKRINTAAQLSQCFRSHNAQPFTSGMAETRISRLFGHPFQEPVLAYRDTSHRKCPSTDI
jgi:hypothetical protein